MSDMKKLLLFSHVCNKRNITGAEKLLLFLAKKLSGYYQCAIVVPKEGELSQLAAQCGIRTIIQNIPLLYGMCLPDEGLAHQAEAFLKDASFKETTRLLSEEQPDYVLVNTSVHAVPAMAAKSMAIPVIWHITEVIANNEYLMTSAEIIDRYSDWVICISESVAAPLRECSGRKLSLLYPSWSWNDFNPHLWPQMREQQRHEWKVDSAEKLIGYISSYLTAEKGADHFINAALELAGKYRDTKFVVIGTEINKLFYRGLRQKVNDSPYAERFIFIDHVSDIEAAFNAMDVVIVPSVRDEGFGLTAMEAMILSKPVIAYASGGLNEILRYTGNDPFLVALGNYQELCAKASLLLEEPGLMESVGGSNRIHIEACFGPNAYDANLQAVVNCINGLTSSNISNSDPPTAQPKSKPRPRARRLGKKARLYRLGRGKRSLRRRLKGSKTRTKRRGRTQRRPKRASRTRKKQRKGLRTSTGR